MLTTTKWIALGLIAAVLAVLIFLVGVGVGSHRAILLRTGGPESGFSAFGMMLPHVFIAGGHGVVGKVASTTSSSFYVMGPDGAIRVFAGSTTPVLGPNGPVVPPVLKAGEQVIIIGEPTPEGGLNAKFIRVSPKQ